MTRTRNVTVLAGFVMLTLILTQQANNAQRFMSLTQTTSFAGRYIAAIADGDFLASTYYDGKLPASNTATDTLSIINLPLTGSQNAIAQSWRFQRQLLTKKSS